MPSERARPLVAFAVVTVVCALVIAVNMLRHPTATTTQIEASPVAQLGPRVEFGTELATRPVKVRPPGGNALAVALSAPVGVATEGRSRAGAAQASGPTARGSHVAAHRHHTARRHPGHVAPTRVHHPPAATTRGHGHGHARGHTRAHGHGARSGHGHAGGVHGSERLLAHRGTAGPGPAHGSRASAAAHGNGHGYGRSLHAHGGGHGRR